MPALTPLSIGKFAKLHLSAREQDWRSNFARPYVLHNALYMTLYAFISVAQGMCIAAYRDPRLCTNEVHWDVLVPLPRKFVDAVCMLSLDDLLSDSEFESVHRYSLVKCAIGCAPFDVD